MREPDQRDARYDVDTALRDREEEREAEVQAVRADYPQDEASLGVLIVHGLKCPDRDGCPVDARRCACWGNGCVLR